MKKFLAKVGAPCLLQNGLFPFDYREDGFYFLEADDRATAMSDLLKQLPQKDEKILSILADLHESFSKSSLFGGGSSESEMKSKPYNNEYYAVCLLEFSGSFFSIPPDFHRTKGCEIFKI